MKAKYCKNKNTYTTEECNGCDNIECGQGIGSLTNQSVSNITKINTERTLNS